MTRSTGSRFQLPTERLRPASHRWGEAPRCAREAWLYTRQHRYGITQTRRSWCCSVDGLPRSVTGQRHSQFFGNASVGKQRQKCRRLWKKRGCCGPISCARILRCSTRARFIEPRNSFDNGLVGRCASEGKRNASSLLAPAATTGNPQAPDESRQRLSGILPCSKRIVLISETRSTERQRRFAQSLRRAPCRTVRLSPSIARAARRADGPV